MKQKTTIIGLTGSIGMGKSAVAQMFRRRRIPVFSADRAVHAMMKPDGIAFKKIAKAFPDSVRQNRIDRKHLGQIVFADAAARKKLESILHPLVARAERDFIAGVRKKGTRAAVLEIPLLFETQAEKRVDIVLCVSASENVQRQRALARPGMTKEKLAAIRARQMSEKEKRQRADFIVPTGCALEKTDHWVQYWIQKHIKGIG